jgi:hypothetical protein
VATIVLVHGMAQEQFGASTLEASWLPALADGLRAGGYPDIAERLWPPDRSSGISARMAYYGDLFLPAGPIDGEVDDEALSDGEQDVAAGLAVECLRRAAGRDHPDRQIAVKQLSYLNLSYDPVRHMEHGAAREVQRSALKRLAKLKWFAPFGMSLAGRFVNTALRQVSAYLISDELRTEIQRRVASLVDADTKVIVGHSLGSVVAYEAAHRLEHQIPLLVTLGSPLGLRTIVYDRVQPQPPGFPPRVRRWVNIADRNDLIAAEPDLLPMFGELAPGAVFDGGWTVRNGALPHQAEFYLTKAQTGRPIGQALKTDARPATTA